MMARMATSTDRKVKGTYKYLEPRRVSFLLPDGRTETDCLTDVVRDLFATLIDNGGTEWNASMLAERAGIPVSSLHAILTGARDPGLHHLERLCCLSGLNVTDELRLHIALIPGSVLDQVKAGEFPFAELRFRASLTGEQIERIGWVIERAVGNGQAEWIVEVIEKIGESLSVAGNTGKKKK